MRRGDGASLLFSYERFAMAHLLVAVDSNMAFGTLPQSKALMRQLADWFSAPHANGIVDVQAFSNDSGVIGSDKFSYSGAGLTLAGGAGSITATINGTAVAVTFATSDTNTCGLLAAAINANTSINRLVEATNNTCQLAFGTPVVGNEVSVLGVKFVAVAGTPQRINEFSTTSPNTSLASAIGAHPSLKGKIYATAPNGSGNIILGKRKNYTLLAGDLVVSNSANVVVTNPNFAAFFQVAVGCITPGLIGNCLTVAFSGTGTGTTFTAAGKMGNGAGGFTQLVDVM